MSAVHASRRNGAALLETNSYLLPPPIQVFWPSLSEACPPSHIVFLTKYSFVMRRKNTPILFICVSFYAMLFQSTVHSLDDHIFLLTSAAVSSQRINFCSPPLASPVICCGPSRSMFLVPQTSLNSDEILSHPDATHTGPIHLNETIEL